MKKNLLHIITLVFFSVGTVLFMFIAFIAGDTNSLLPLKISPQTPTEQYAPQQKNKYTPHELHRIYLFEHIHKSVERGKKGITS